MTPITRDSGTQPTPHYCTREVRPAGHRAGCPDWPLCLFPLPLPPGRTLTLVKPSPPDLPDDDDDLPGIGIWLTNLLGVVAYVIILACALAILLPFIV